MLISTGQLTRQTLQGKTVVVTGAGGGIGLEAVRALLWLGAMVVIAEIDGEKGRQAEQLLQSEFGSECITFLRTDVSCEESVKQLKDYALRTFGKVDVVLNNATIAVTGAIHELGTAVWDKSYAVNLRGPVLMTQTFLPDMLERNQGAMIFVSSSGAAPYLGGYEVFKTAQVELANTLAAELENTRVAAFTIGPGIVKTETADDAIHRVAPLYGMTVEQFYEINASHLLSVEAAGAGFAAAVALADRYHGTEIGSIQALMDAGISLAGADAKQENAGHGREIESILPDLAEVKQTLSEQVDGWYKRNIFERQWMLRDFKKNTGVSPEVFLQRLATLEDDIRAGRPFEESLRQASLHKLVEYYQHMFDLMKGYERNPAKAQEHATIINGWKLGVERLLQRL